MRLGSLANRLVSLEPSKRWGVAKSSVIFIFGRVTREVFNPKNLEFPIKFTICLYWSETTPKNFFWKAGHGEPRYSASKFLSMHFGLELPDRINEDVSINKMWVIFLYHRIELAELHRKVSYHFLRKSLSDHVIGPRIGNLRLRFTVISHVKWNLRFSNWTFAWGVLFRDKPLTFEGGIFR